MKKDNKIYICAACNRNASELHELWFGKNRQNCIKYNLQLPLCRICHSTAHDRKPVDGFSPLQKYVLHKARSKRVVIDVIAIRRYFVEEIFKLDYWECVRALEFQHMRTYIIEHKDYCGKIIESFLK